MAIIELREKHKFHRLTLRKVDKKDCARFVRSHLHLYISTRYADVDRSENHSLYRSPTLRQAADREDLRLCKKRPHQPLISRFNRQTRATTSHFSSIIFRLSYFLPFCLQYYRRISLLYLSGIDSYPQFDFDLLLNKHIDLYWSFKCQLNDRDPIYVSGKGACKLSFHVGKSLFQMNIFFAVLRRRKRIFYWIEKKTKDVEKSFFVIITSIILEV